VPSDGTLFFLSALAAERKKGFPLCGLRVSNERSEWVVNKRS